MRPGRVKMMILGLAVLLCLAFFPALAQEKEETEKPWTGKLGDGRVITRADLEKILQAHALWVKSNSKEGQKAALSKATLIKIDLRRADLSKADLHEAELIGGDLRGTNLCYSDMSRANLSFCDLSNAALFKADLRDAKLLSSNLTNANLHGADLTRAFLFLCELHGTNFTVAVLSQVTFDPKAGTVPDASKIGGIHGLSSLKYFISPHGLLELREVYKKSGEREQEREVTCALNRTRRVKLWDQGLWGKVESLFNRIFFEETCRYGMSPGRPLKILGLGLLLFAPFYMLALRSRDRETGIWLVLLPDRVLGRGGKDRPVKLTTHTPFRPHPPGRWARLRDKLRRLFRVVRLGLYFSLLSAFTLGWRELNVGNWITRLQKHEYTLRATGWVRTVAGCQSLLSVYLLALWVLSYFGRPFD